MHNHQIIIVSKDCHREIMLLHPKMELFALVYALASRLALDKSVKKFSLRNDTIKP